MSPVEAPVTPDLEDRVALVLAQLAPIPSRVALLDSYRRESLCRLPAGDCPDLTTDVIELAYARRWAQLDAPARAEEAIDWEYLDG